MPRRARRILASPRTYTVVVAALFLAGCKNGGSGGGDGTGY